MAFVLTANGRRDATATERSDDDLMAAFGRDDAGAFDVLYARYREPVYGYLYRNCRDETVAAELFQDVWLRVIASAGRYKRRGRFRSWLFSLAHNRLVDFYREADRVRGEEPLDDETAIEYLPVEESKETV